MRVHRSRFAIFSNPLPTDWLAVGAGIGGYGIDSRSGWGQSVFEPIRKALVNAEAVCANTAALVEEAKVDVVQIPNLASYMNNESSQQKLVERFALASLLKANNSMVLLGGDETFSRKQI